MRTPTTPLSALTLCAAVATLALAGCATDPDPGQTPTPVLSWSAEDEAEAIAEAEQAIRDYWQVRSQCLDNLPNADPSCFDEVAYGDLLVSDKEALKDAQDYGFRYMGETLFIRTDRIISVDLSGAEDQEIRLAVCTNRESFDILRPDGTSVWPIDAPLHVQSVYVVFKHTNKWQVADITDDPDGIEC